MAAIPPGAAGNEIDRIRSLVAERFPVYETRVSPRSVLFLVHADAATLEANFDRLRQDMWTRFYVPQLRKERGEYVVEVVRRPPQNPWGATANLVLLALTLLTTMFAGAFLWVAWRGGHTLLWGDIVDGGLFFALPLMTILGVHELAHYVLARHHHVEASLPYFVPVPPPFLLFGTFGAFISLREPIPTKKALLDIGAAGPLAGLAVALPVTLVGLTFSVHAPSIPISDCGPTFVGFSYGGLTYGSSLLWGFLGLFLPSASFAHLHPLALAGWVGLLVTAINLLPAGQLDGGHVFRALLGDRARFVSYAAVILLTAMGFYYEGWFLFAILVFILGVRHPPPLNDITPLDAKRWAVGGLAVAVLVSGFVVIPIGAAPSPALALSAGSVAQPALPPGYAMADNASLTVHDLDAVTHGYLASGKVTAVYATVNGTSTSLTGAALAEFEANSTWIVTSPSGAATIIAGNASFSVPASDAFSVNGGASATFHVLYLNGEKAVVIASLTATELCPNGAGPATVSETFS